MINSEVFRAVVALVNNRLATRQMIENTTMVTTRSVRVGLIFLSESRPVTVVSMPL